MQNIETNKWSAEKFIKEVKETPATIANRLIDGT